MTCLSNVHYTWLEPAPRFGEVPRVRRRKPQADASAADHWGNEGGIMSFYRKGLTVTALLAVLFSVFAGLGAEAAQAAHYVAAGAVWDSKANLAAEGQFGIGSTLFFKGRTLGGKGKSQWDLRAKWKAMPVVGLSAGVFGFEPRSGKTESGTLVGLWAETAIASLDVHGEVAYALDNVDGERLMATVGARYAINEPYFVEAQVTRGLNRKNPVAVLLLGAQF